MEPAFNRFWRTLFDAEEQTCFARYTQGTSVRPVVEAGEAKAWAQFFSINPLTPGGRRADAQVAAHRNFLLEFDDVPLDDQLEIVRHSGLPVSTCVYSGGKSFHFIVALDRDVGARMWRRLAKGLVKAFLESDAAVKNPSRLSRFPEGVRLVRDEDGVVTRGPRQHIVFVGERVSLDELWEWFLVNAPHALGGKEFRALALARPGELRPLNRRTEKFLREGARVGTRNHDLFIAACDAASCGLDYAAAQFLFSSVLPKLQDFAAPFTSEELERTVRSAYRHVLGPAADPENAFGGLTLGQGAA